MRQKFNDDIIKKLLAGDNSCFVDISTHCKRYCIGGLIRKNGCSKELAEELFIEALLELREMVIKRKVDNILNLKSYIFGICNNMWLNETKRKEKQVTSEDHIERYFNEYIEQDTLFQEDVEYKSNLIKISLEAINKLGDKCKQIIKLYYLDKLSMSQIAQRLNFANANVAKTSKNRCFKKLMDEVDEIKTQIEL